jgi:hypothetical protein
VQYTGALSPRVTMEGTVSRFSNRLYYPWHVRNELDQEVLLAKTTYVLPTSAGDHVLTAGGALSGTDGNGYGYDETVLFVNDRWAHERWVIEAGLRKQTFANYAYHPRLAVVYDIRGNGRHAASATYASYSEPYFGFVRALTVGYTAALGSSGSFRADVLRQERGSDDQLSVQLDAGWRLFDRLTAGANYTWSGYDDVYGTPRHAANGWLSLDFPLGTQVVGVTVLQRYRTEAASTDLALRYRVPAGRTMLTLAGDVTNVFNDINYTSFIQYGRALRLWARVRL